MNVIEEKAILIAVDRENDILSTEESLEELRELAKTAGAETVAIAAQKRERPHPALYLGRGKVDELKVLIDETEATAIIADDELSPAQTRNLSEQLKVKILDRTVIILDIFAQRASTREGKIQVELAQQKYRLSHLAGIGTQLSRLGGGIGTRGPGEKKLETDRRHIRDAISNLSSELKEIERHRELLRKNSQKSGIPTLSIVGYTNAGKSTLLNSLTQAGVLAEDKLFATLDTTQRRLKLPNGGAVQLTDTVGFISKLPHQLIKAFKATLEELNHADILLHVVDASNENFKSQISVVEDVLKQIGCFSKPVITAYNKIDLCTDLFEPSVMSNNVLISAIHNRGLHELLVKVEDTLKSLRTLSVFRIPYSDGGSISLLHNKAEIIAEEHLGEYTQIEAYVSEEVLGRLRKYV